jgi:hypothetical protein
VEGQCARNFGGENLIEGVARGLQQASYGSGNAFLDTLATHRARLGDSAVSFQWTSWG